MYFRLDKLFLMFPHLDPDLLTYKTALLYTFVTKLISRPLSSSVQETIFNYTIGFECLGLTDFNYDSSSFHNRVSQRMITNIIASLRLALQNYLTQARDLLISIGVTRTELPILYEEIPVPPAPDLRIL